MTRAARYVKARLPHWWLQALSTNVSMVQLVVEVDGIAVAMGCALIVESKNVLTSEYVLKLADKLDVLRWAWHRLPLTTLTL